MDRLTNSNQLLFYKVLTESQHLLTYSRVVSDYFCFVTKVPSIKTKRVMTKIKLLYFFVNKKVKITL